MSLRTLFKVAVGIGVLGICEGIYGFLSFGYDLGPRPSDVWACLGSAGGAVLIPAVILVLASVVGLMKSTNRTIAAICLILAVLTAGMVLWGNILFVSAILKGACSGTYPAIPTIPVR